MTNFRRYLIIFIAGSLWTVIVSCQIMARESKSPEPTFTVQPNALSIAEDMWNSAMEAAPGETVTFTLTEPQLSSIIAELLTQSQYDVLKNPYVLLKEGQIEVYGEFKQDPITSPASILIKPTIDQTGNLDLEVISAKIGPLPAPQNLLDMISNTLQNAILSSLGSDTLGIKFMQVQINNGLLILTGIRV